MYHQTCSRILLIFFIVTTHIKRIGGENIINIMLINAADNQMVEYSVDEAFDYLQSVTEYEIKFECVIRVNSQNTTDGQLFLDYICEKYAEAISINCKPHLILDFTVGGPLSEAAKTFSATLGIPTVASVHGTFGEIRPWNKLDTNKWLHLIQVSPPADVMLQIIKGISRFQKMTSAAIIYDETFRLDMVTQSVLEDIAVRQVLFKVEDSGTLDSELVQLRELDIVNYFILGSLNTARVVLDSAVHNSYYNTKFSWHVITQDEGLLKILTKNISVLVLSPISKRCSNYSNPFYRYQRFMSEITFSFYYDLTVKAVLSFLSLSSTEKGLIKISNNFSQCPKERIFTTSSIDLRTHFIKVNQSYNYGPIALNSNGTGIMEFEMRMELVTTGNSSPGVVGYWSSKEEELTVFGNLTDHSAKAIYKIAIIVLPPFVMESKDENGNENYTGYCIDLIYEISQIMNFEYELYRVPDNTPGTMDEHGKWSGVINEVLEKRADIGLSSMSVTAERQDVVEFTIPFYDLVGMNILMKKSKPTTAYFKFFSAMGRDVWCCLMVVYIIASALIWTFEQFSPLIRQDYHQTLWGTGEKREFTIKECLWFCMTSLTPQGGGEGLSTTSSRVIAAVWWLFGLILLASYTANLAAFLTVSRMDTSISSLEDLSNQYKIQYAPMNGSSGQTYFQRMAAIENQFQRDWMDIVLKENMSYHERSELALWNYPMGTKFTKMWKSMLEAGLPLSLQDAVDRVLASKSSSDGFALIADGNLVKYYSMTNCDLQVVGEEFCKLALAIALQKGSPLTELINRALTTLLHKRRLNQLKEKWWDENPDRKVCPEQDELAEGISIYNIGGVFSVMIVGTLLACIILFFEYCCPKQVYLRRQLKQQKNKTIQKFR